MPGVLTILVFIDPVLPEFTIIGRTGWTSTQDSADKDQQEEGQRDSHHWIPLHWDAGLKGSGEVTWSAPALGAAICGGYGGSQSFVSGTLSMSCVLMIDILLNL